jgi:type IV fimbrial biogenesis protein FimT
MIETLVVMAIAAILLSVAVPSFQYVTNVNRIAGEVNGLLGDLQFARVEAIKEGQTVTACTSSNGTSCDGSSAWNGGWIVFADANGNATVDAGESVLRVQSPFTSTDTFTATNGVSAVTYNRDGFATGASIAAGTLITLHAATPNIDSTKCLMVTMLGQIAVLSGNSSFWTFSCT